MKQLSFLPGEMTPQDRRLIQRALRALDRHLHEPGVAFTSTHAVREWLRLHMAALEREEFRVLYLDNQNQLIGLPMKRSSPARLTAPRCIPGRWSNVLCTSTRRR